MSRTMSYYNGSNGSNGSSDESGNPGSPVRTRSIARSATNMNSNLEEEEPHGPSVMICNDSYDLFGYYFVFRLPNTIICLYPINGIQRAFTYPAGTYLFAKDMTPQAPHIWDEDGSICYYEMQSEDIVFVPGVIPMGPGTRFHYVTNNVIVDATENIVTGSHRNLAERIMESLAEHMPVSRAHDALVADITDVLTHGAPAPVGQAHLGGRSRRIRKTRKARGKRR